MGSLRSIEYGDGEALVTTVMPSEFESELGDLWLHPALMDVATGSAQALIPDFAPEDMFYVPFSYGRVLSRRPLPATAVSHVRLRSATAHDLAVFDITICDEHGEEAAVIESFTMRRISGSTSLTSLRRTESPIAEPAGIESTVGAAMREGILPAEGVDAFDRIVALRARGAGRRVLGRRRALDGQGRRRSRGFRRRRRRRAARSTSDPTSAPTSWLRPRRSNVSWPRCGAECSVSSGSVATTTSSSSAVSR